MWLWLWLWLWLLCVAAVAAVVVLSRLFSRHMRRFDQLRALFGRIRMMWFAPHVEKPPNDSIPPDALREALRDVWAGMAANRFLQHTADLSNNPHASIQLIADLAPVVVPLWEEAAVKLGLPRSMEGIGRLQLAACCAVRSALPPRLCCASRFVPHVAMHACCVFVLHTPAGA